VGLSAGLESWEPGGGAGGEHSLVDLVNRVLDKGVVITGDVTISVAGVDLVYLGLSAVLTSVSTARNRMGRTGVGSGTADDGSDGVAGDGATGGIAPPGGGSGGDPGSTADGGPGAG
jgi:hypothetical protein